MRLLGFLVSLLLVGGISATDKARGQEQFDILNRDSLVVSNARWVDREVHVSVKTHNDEELAGLVVPLTFGSLGDRIVLERVEWAPSVEDWDLVHAQIYNDEKRVILGLISDMTGERGDAALSVSPANGNIIATLIFSGARDSQVTIGTFSTSRPTRELAFVYNEYIDGKPHVREFRPEFRVRLEE